MWKLIKSVDSIKCIPSGLERFTGRINKLNDGLVLHVLILSNFLNHYFFKSQMFPTFQCCCNSHSFWFIPFIFWSLIWFIFGRFSNRFPASHLPVEALLSKFNSSQWARNKISHSFLNRVWLKFRFSSVDWKIMWHVVLAPFCGGRF